MPANIDLEACYRRYGPLVYRRCLRLLRSEAQAEEAMQHVFVELMRRQERLEDRGNVFVELRPEDRFRPAVLVDPHRVAHPDDETQLLYWPGFTVGLRL